MKVANRANRLVGNGFWVDPYMWTAQADVEVW